MNCEIVCVGTELILGDIVNSNASWLAEHLALEGIDSYYQTVVGDNLKRAAEVIKNAAVRSDIVIITGGLGPTEDDLTREAIAEAFQKKLEFKEYLAQNIQDKFKTWRRPMPEANLRQAYLPEGAKPILPTVGTAPGLILEIEKKLIFALPGVPFEMKKMFHENILPYIKERMVEEKAVIISRIIKVWGLAEADVYERIKEIVSEQTNPTLAFLVKNTEVHLRLTAKAEDKEVAHRLIQREEERIVSILADAVFGFDDETMEAVVGDLLRRQHLHLGVAESCTGGLIGHRITNVAGSSDYFLGSIVSYDNEIKSDVLGVSRETLFTHGAVSSQVAEEMAIGVRKLMKSDIGLSATGIAGPSGGSDEKPVGLVYTGFSVKEFCASEKYLFPYFNRDTVKLLASYAGLNTLRLHLLQREGGGDDFA